jgi:serine/threonine protein kinase
VDVKHLFRQLLIGVAHLHSRDLCHRDLKPENFLLTGERPFSVKIADFGIATRVDPRNRLRCLKDGDRLRCSPGYGAPEIVRREAYGLPADMWSVGVLLYFMLTGLSPFHGNTKEETLKLMSKGNYDRAPLSKHGPAVLDLVTRLLELDPTKRLTADQALKHPWVCETVLMTVEEPEGEDQDRSGHGGMPSRLMGAKLEGAFRNPSLHEMSVEPPKNSNLFLDVSVHDSFWKSDEWLKNAPPMPELSVPPTIDEILPVVGGNMSHPSADGDDSDVGSARQSLDSQGRPSLDQTGSIAGARSPTRTGSCSTSKGKGKFAPLDMISNMVKKVRLKPKNAADETVHGFPNGE